MLAKLEDYWSSVRLHRVDIPAAHLLINAGSNKPSDLATIEDALDIYFKLKGSSRDKTFDSAGRRNIGYVVECLGCRALDNYSTAGASSFRDWLIGKGLAGSSIKRMFGSIKAIVSMVIQGQPHPWRSLKISSSKRVIPLVGCNRGVTLPAAH